MKEQAEGKGRKEKITHFGKKRREMKETQGQRETSKQTREEVKDGG